MSILSLKAASVYVGRNQEKENGFRADVSFFLRLEVELDRGQGS